MINWLGHEIVDLFKLAGESVDEIFLLSSHLMCGQIAHRFDLIGQLGGHLAKERIWLIDLILKIFFGSAHCIKDLGTELLKVIFEAHKIAFQSLILVFVGLEIDVLLLGNFFAERNLLESILDLRLEAIILVVLSRNGGCSGLILLFVDKIYVVFQLLIFYFKCSDFLFEFSDLFIGIVLSTSQHTVLQRLSEKFVIPFNWKQPWN